MGMFTLFSDSYQDDLTGSPVPADRGCSITNNSVTDIHET